MLTQHDLDILMQEIQENGSAIIYYVAHMIEIREGILDEHVYKSNSQFKVIKLNLTNIYNAYFEYKNYLNNPSNYHEESEESYYDPFTRYINLYTVPNGNNTYTKDFNPRMPSIIYGYRRKINYLTTGTSIIVNDPTPVSVIYTNNLEYGDLNKSQITASFNDHKLDWKYQKLNRKINVDGVEYEYITSDWYILDITNFPKVEKPLINVKQHSAYFTNIESAFNYIEQLES